MMLQDLKSILIGLCGNEERPSPALRYGLSLARQAEAHASICALSTELTLTHAFVSDVAAGLVATENKRMRGLAEDRLERALQDARAEGTSCSAEVLQAHFSVLAAKFAKRARVHDLTVFDAEPDPLSVNRGLLEEALFNGGRPMIVVPPEIETFRIDNVVVAWDGSAKATRAVNDALPLLRAAQQVEIVCIPGEKDLSKSLPGADLAQHLTRHQVKCMVKELPAKDGNAGEALRAEARQFGADLIVMGAFVHSRLRQLVLGGVTHSMLKSSTVPLLLSH